MSQITDLENKYVLITGASTGIGAELARAFAAQGARLALHFNSHEAEIRALVAELAGGSGDDPTDQAARDTLRRLRSRAAAP